MIQLEITECGNRLEVLVEEAIAFIDEHFPVEQGFWEVAFSGGKDSIVLYDIVKEWHRRTGKAYRVHMVNTTIEMPEVLKFVREEYQEVQIINAPGFFRMMKSNGFPMQQRRWCCTTQKKRPAPKRDTLCGVRSEESSMRSKCGRKVCREHCSYYPIYNFITSDIWQYIRYNNLSYPILYDNGFDRIGCVFCPYVFGTKSGRLRMERWQRSWNALEYHFKKYLSKYLERRQDRQKIDLDDAWNRYICGKNIFDSKITEDEFIFEFGDDEDEI